MVAVEQKYFMADRIGVITGSEHQLLGSFFDNNGLNSLWSRLPYILHQAATVNTLKSLEEAVKKYIGADQFTTPYRSPNELPQPYNDTWTRFQGAFNEVLGKEYLLVSGVAAGRTLISNQAAFEAVPQLPWENYPDLMAVSLEDGVAMVTDIFELKSSDVDGVRTIAEAEKIRRTLLHPLKSTLIRQAISDITQTPFEYVLLPGSEELILTLVASKEALSSDGLRDNLRDYYDKTIIIGVPSPKNYAFFILGLLTGSVRTEEKWERYFQPIDPMLAEAILFGRSDKRLHPKRNRPA